jgi:hypothetical protein
MLTNLLIDDFQFQKTQGFIHPSYEIVLHSSIRMLEDAAYRQWFHPTNFEQILLRWLILQQRFCCRKKFKEEGIQQLIQIRICKSGNYESDNCVRRDDSLH